MSKIRFQALYEALRHKPVDVETPLRQTEIFAERVFGPRARRQYLTKESFRGVEEAIKAGTKIDRDLADQISTGMKEWAISKGATHYTHWFQPLTGSSAEKHDSFLIVIKGYILFIMKNSFTLKKLLVIQKVYL